MAKYYICLDIGGTKVLGVIFNSKREIVYRIKKKTKAGGDDSQNIENTIITLVEELISEFKISIKDVAAIAAGAPAVTPSSDASPFSTEALQWLHIMPFTLNSFFSIVLFSFFSLNDFQYLAVNATVSITIKAPLHSQLSHDTAMW